MIKLFSVGAISAVLAAAIPLSADAATYSGKLIRMTNEWGGGYYILELNGVKSLCSPYFGFTIPASNPQYKEIVATAMMAFSMNKTVDITTDANQTCQNGRVVTIAVQINY